MEEVSGVSFGFECEKYDSSQALVEILSRHLTQWELKYGKGEDEETLSDVLQE